MQKWDSGGEAVYGVQIDSEINEPLPELRSAGDERSWYAIQTVARHEKRVAQQLRQNGVDTFLPLVERIRDWSDRQALVELPLFSCYAFVRIVQNARERLQV